MEIKAEFKVLQPLETARGIVDELAEKIPIDLVRILEHRIKKAETEGTPITLDIVRALFSGYFHSHGALDEELGENDPATELIAQWVMASAQVYVNKADEEASGGPGRTSSPVEI